MKCDARKIWEFDDETNELTVYHYGLHSCVPKHQQSETVKEKVESIFQQFPKMKPSQVSSKVICEAIEKGNWDEVNNIASDVANLQTIANIKKKTLRELQPNGHLLGKLLS